MNVVIVGATDRKSIDDRLLVNKLIDLAYRTYPECVFVTTLSHTGVGKFVKDKCMEKTAENANVYQLVECSIRVFATTFSRPETMQVLLAANAALFELGDVFYFFASEDRRGTTEELITKRVIPSGRAYKIFLPGQDVSLV